MAPRLTCVRNLVGHSGRVEALAAHGGLGRLVSSGRDSSLKVRAWGLLWGVRCVTVSCCGEYDGLL